MAGCGLLLLILGIAVPPGGQAESPKNTIYKVGVVPQFEARRLHQIWRPILDELQRHTGYRFELVGSPTIPAFENEFMAGAFDFAYMNPYHLMLAHDTEGYLPLVRDRGRTLYGILAVRKDSNVKDIKDIKELQGKVVAFPAPNALGASLQIRQELKDYFGVQVKPRYVKTHDSVYLNVVLRQAAAGGGVQKTLARQRPEVRNALRVIHKTTPVPPHPLAAHPRVPAIVRERVRNAMLKIGVDEEGRKLLLRVPIKQLGLTSIDDYLPLRDLGLQRFYLKSN